MKKQVWDDFIGGLLFAVVFSGSIVGAFIISCYL